MIDLIVIKKVWTFKINDKEFYNKISQEIIKAD